MQLHAFQIQQRRMAVVFFPGLLYIPMPKGRGFTAMFDKVKASRHEAGCFFSQSWGIPF
jgi:hypothetical protein